MIIGGFCGGAVTAAFAADPSNSDALGLMMLDPEIALTPTPEVRAMHEVDTESSFLERLELIKRRLRSPASWRRLLTGGSDLRYWKGLLDYAWKRRRASTRAEEPPPRHQPPPAGGMGSVHAPQDADAGNTARGITARRKYYRSYNLEPGRSDAAARLTWHGSRTLPTRC